MPIRKSKKRIKKPKSAQSWSAKTAIIAVIVLFIFLGLFLSRIAVAAEGDEKKVETAWYENLAIKIAQWLMKTILSTVHFILKWVVIAAAALLELVLKLGFKEGLVPVVEEGWKVTRDLANMFFILAMIVVAFATILRIEQYGIKKLLPKIIIIALLVNFSFVICGVIIDLTNIAAIFFIDSIQTDLGPGSLGAGLTDGLNLMKVDASQQSDFPEISPGQKQELEKTVEGLGAQSIGLEYLQFILSLTIGSLVLLVAAFAMAAGAVFIIIRAIIIWFLLIFVPFIFVCYILPGLRNLWQKWWSMFLKWCLFAPAYAFFIWLALKIVSGGGLKRVVEGSVKSTVIWPQTGGGAGIVSAFAMFPQYLINFGFVIALLLGGIVAASKFGIYGAGAVMKVGQKAYGGAKSWAARTSMRPIKALGTTAGAGALTAGGKLFGGKIGRRMKARATQLREAAAERPEHKKYRAVAERMSNADLQKEVIEAKGVRGLIATRIAEKRGILREADRPVARQARETLHKFGATEEARRLEENRPDSIEDKTERKEAEERAISKGIHKNWSGKVFEEAEGAEIVEETRQQLGTGEFAKVFKGWAKDVKDKAEEALRSGFTDNFADKTNIERRNTYAASTGKVNQAFFGDQSGTIQSRYKADANAQKETRTYIENLKDEGFGELKTDEDRDLTAAYMAPSQVYGAGTKLSGREKNRMRRVAQRMNPRAYNRMQRADTWAT